MDITLPNLPIFGSTRLDGQDIYSMFYNPALPAESLSVLYGNIDSDNLISTANLDRSNTQRGSICEAWVSAGTANLDYPAAAFAPNVDTTTLDMSWSVLTNLSRFNPQPIPGLNRTIPILRESIILAYWSVTFSNAWAAPFGSDGYCGVVFTIDDVVQGDTARIGGIMADVDVSGTRQDAYHDWKMHKKIRVYSGHYQTPSSDVITPGWVSCGLSLILSNITKMVRIHACHLVVVRLNA